MSDEQQDQGYTLVDLAWDGVVSFDYITPMLQFAGEAAGLVTVEGTGREINILRARGVRVYNPMAIVGTGGDYLFQISKGDVKRVQKMLGGRK